VIALALVVSFWFMGYGIALGLLGSMVPIWFARQLAARPTSAFAAGTAVYGLVLGAWLIVGPDMRPDQRVLSASAALIAGVVSALAWWHTRGLDSTVTSPTATDDQAPTTTDYAELRSNGPALVLLGGVLLAILGVGLFAIGLRSIGLWLVPCGGLMVVFSIGWRIIRIPRRSRTG
jgi:hypothetical protein